MRATPRSAPAGSGCCSELRDWNTAHEKMGAIKYGQSQLDNSDKLELEKDGVGFTGSACSELTLLRLAYAFEQATHKRTSPPGLR